MGGRGGREGRRGAIREDYANFVPDSRRRPRASYPADETRKANRVDPMNVRGHISGRRDAEIGGAHPLPRAGGPCFVVSFCASRVRVRESPLPRGRRVESRDVKRHP